MSPSLGLGLICLAAWVYLLAFRGGFWRGRERDDADQPAEPAAWPAVVAVVPARNEADVVAQAIGSLRRQDYPGAFRIILVDDDSDDGTAEAARRAEGDHPFEVMRGAPLAEGWTGKLWAQSQGVAKAAETAPAYIWFTDADISHDRSNLRALVARAEEGGLALTSLMVRLTVRSGWERLLIPAFVFFFQMLFPFAWVNDPRRRTAAAAGGCMLARRDALEASGGLAAIGGEIIDDCALARTMKRQGPIWLGLTRRAQSLRPYAGLGQIGRMVARSAYAQLGFSPWLLAGTVVGMVVVFALPALLWLVPGPGQPLGLLAWIAMGWSIQPTLRIYRLWGVWGFTLPLAGVLYGAFTLWSAIEHWRGRGGLWKGRVQAGGYMEVRG
ncbi:MAG TPA: glycosyltransferase [Caulobacteraceae bacterium]|jgi:hopene-associated glycosyltransferase HpnB